MVNSTTFSVSPSRFPSPSFSLGGLQAQAEETGFLSLFICGVDVTCFISYMPLRGPEMMDFLCLWDGGTEIGSRFALLLESHVNPGDYHMQLCLVWHSVPISTHVFVLNTGAPLVCWFFFLLPPCIFFCWFPLAAVIGHVQSMLHRQFSSRTFGRAWHEKWTQWRCWLYVVHSWNMSNIFLSCGEVKRWILYR